MKVYFETKGNTRILQVANDPTCIHPRAPKVLICDARFRLACLVLEEESPSSSHVEVLTDVQLGWSSMHNLDKSQFPSNIPHTNDSSIANFLFPLPEDICIAWMRFGIPSISWRYKPSFLVVSSSWRTTRLIRIARHRAVGLWRVLHAP